MADIMEWSRSGGDAAQFEQDMLAYKNERLNRGKCAGPQYGDNVHLWFDQVFEWGIAPSGTVDCSQPLRVGSTQNALDIVLVACHDNSQPLTIAAGATITVTLSEGDAVNGDFEEVGPTICVKAGAAGMICEPGQTVARFALGNFAKPWLKVKLEFAGSISGGLVDCGLGYVPR